eukprot:EG_transcript_45764
MADEPSSSPKPQSVTDLLRASRLGKLFHLAPRPPDATPAGVQAAAPPAVSPEGSLVAAPDTNGPPAPAPAPGDPLWPAWPRLIASGLLAGNLLGLSIGVGRALARRIPRRFYLPYVGTRIITYSLTCVTGFA